MSAPDRVLALDLDGTLLDCRARQMAALGAVSRAAECSLDLERVWENKRAGAGTLQALEAAGLAAPLARRLTRAWIRMIEDAYWLAYDRMLPGVRPALEAVGKAGFTRVVLTARGRPALVPGQLQRVGLSGVLDRVHVVSPQAAQAQKARLLCDLGAVAMVGDTESDLEAARRARVPFIAVSGGQRSSRFLAMAGACTVTTSLADALAIVTSPPRVP